MSDTPTHPAEPEPTPTPQPEPPPADTPAPEGEPEGQPRDEAGRFKSPEPESRFDRRLGVMRAQVGMLQRERDQIAARLAALEQGRVQGQQPQLDPQLEAFIEQRADEKAQQKIEQAGVRTFHEQGSQRYPDWQQRCTDLQNMGADAGFAKLLVKMPDGAKVAGALRDDPDEVERIASLPQDDRAFALGQYAARLEAAPMRQVSRAPPPPKPLPGRSSPSPNVYQMEANDLAAHWMREALEAQKRR